MPSDLTELLGQKAIVDTLIDRLSNPGARVWLVGPSGSGKTTIVAQVAAQLENTRTVMRIAGDAGNGGTKFLALHRGLQRSRPRKALRDAAKSGVTAPLRVIPLVGSLASELAKIAVAGIGVAPPEFLSAEQQDLLQGLQNASGGRQMTLIVDDTGWLDPDSAQLLLNLVRPEIQRAYSFAKEITILFVENQEAEATLDATLMEQLREPDPIVVTRIPKELFPEVLEAFGMTRRLSKGMLHSLFAIAQGHLEVTKQIVRIDTGTALQNLLEAPDPTTFIMELLRTSLSLTGERSDLLRLLTIAACSGTAFPESELKCAFMDDEGFSQAFKSAISRELLAVDGSVVRFVHEVIRSAAERLGSPDTPALHGKLAECVKLLRPGDYAGRLHHILRSEDAKSGEEIAFALAVQAVRGERETSPGLPNLGDLSALFDAMTSGYRHMDLGEHREAIDRLMPFYTGEFNLVQGEIVALIALNQIKRRTQEAYCEAAGLLEHWQAWQEERELWQRLMSTLISAWTAADQGDRARELFGKLQSSLLFEGRSDPSARTRAEALNRKSDMLFTSEIAVKHIARAVDWFGPGDGDTPRHAFEYTSSLVNLSGAQYTLGRFSQAAENAANAVRWIELLHDRGLRTAEPYKALNNYLIAAYRAETEAAEAAEAALAVMLRDGERSWRQDRCLQGINKAAFSLLAGKLDQGLSLLEQIWSHVLDQDLDHYYALFAGSNLAVARAAMGDRKAATALINTMDGYLTGVPRWFRGSHTRRLEFLREAISDTGVVTAQEFDAFPMHRRRPDGNQDAWWSIGRGFLMSDIQVWSEG